MSLPLLHAGRTNPGLSAALDLRFALDKSLTAYRGPTPSFSRASTGSYFDASGVLRYANVNTILYSEEFDNAYWTKVRCSVTANNSTSPTGKNSADLITQTSGQTVAGGITRTISWVSGTTYTASIYAKKIDKNRIMIIERSTGDGRGTFFNISNGTVGTTDPNHTASIQDAGNGWYRCSITFSGSTISDALTIYHVDNESTTVIGSGSTLFWGAQLEASSTVGTYCPTTSAANSAPRFNHTYNGTSWVSRGLLVEEQRTNSSPYSVTFNSGNAPWGVADLSISLNSATAPDGTNTATKIIEGTGAGNHNIYRVFPFTGTITWSVFAKAAERNYIQIFIGNLNSPETGINVDLTNGAITNQSPSVVASGTQDVGNGWYRIWFSVTGSGGTYYPAVGTSNSATGIRSSYTGNGTSGVYIWGAQWESGSFPTSYIGNSGSGSTTRSADVCQITGGDFSGFWNGTEGSVVAEFDVSSGYTSPDLTIANFYQSGSSWIGLRSISSTSNNIFDCYSAGVQQARLGFSRSNPGISTRLAAAFKANDFAASQNGSAVSTDTSGSLPSPTYLELGTFTGFGEYLNGHIARLRYFNKRLPNADLRFLTGGSKAFQPDNINGLQLWLDASDLSTLYQSSGGSPATSDGDPIGYWGDRSGNGRHALQTDGTKKPVLKLGLQNNKNVVNFDGVNDWADFSAVPSENITWFIVLKLAQNKDQVLLNTPNNEAPGYAVYKAANNTYTSFGNTTFSGSANTEILGGTRGTTTGTFRKNGISGNITSPAGSTGITKLASFSTSNLFVVSGYICEVIFYNSILSSTQIGNVELYLNTKWGVY